MAFEQVQIPVQKTEEFEELRSAIERVFTAPAVGKFLKKLTGGGVAIRQFEKALESGIFEKSDPVLAQSGRRAQQLYGALTLSDQALIREFYLERIEQVDPKVRQKFQKVYRYY